VPAAKIPVPQTPTANAKQPSANVAEKAVSSTTAKPINPANAQGNPTQAEVQKNQQQGAQQRQQQQGSQQKQGAQQQGAQQRQQKQDAQQQGAQQQGAQQRQQKQGAQQQGAQQKQGTQQKQGAQQRQQRPPQNAQQKPKEVPPAPAPKQIARKPVPKKTEERPLIRAAEHPNLFTQPAVEVNPLPEAMGAGAQSTQALSPESRRILNDLPAGIDRKPPTPAIQPLNVDRTTRNAALATPPSDNAATPEENVGLKIATEKPRLDVNAELRRAYDAHQAGNSAAAAEIYAQVLDTTPNNTQALLGLATSYHRLGRIEKARPLYGKLLAIDRNNRAGLNNFLLLLADEAPKEALEQLQSLEAQNPDFAAIPAQMAAIYQKLGQPREAIESIARAIRLAPNNMNYRYNLAILLDHQRSYAQAATLYTQILEAHSRGEAIPGDPRRIQERLTFIRSNRR
jgi:Ca-activated chloride channel family protein